jgi:RHS repeat-associated protein
MNIVWVTIFAVWIYGGLYLGRFDASNTFGPLGLVLRHVASGNGHGFFAYDPSGNTVQQISSTGSVLETDLYDAYGNLLSGTASQTDPYGFGAQWGYFTDYTTGVTLAGHRYYDPAAGRWLNRDPIGYDGGLNLYGYVGDDPENAVDPSGHFIWIVAGAVVGAVIGGAVAYHNGDNVWVGAGEGAVIGAVAAATGGAAAGAAAGLVEGLGGGVVAQGIVGGVAGGAAADAAGQGTAIVNGWQRGFSWPEFGVSTAIGGALGYGWGIGGEIKIGSRFRLAPFGNRTGDACGELPHYHRSVPDQYNPGNSMEGQGIGRHRPWQTKSNDTGFSDRF